MRFAVASVALLALAHSLAPGVHGAPAVVSDHANSLAVRQDPGALVTTLLGSLVGVIQGLLGTATSIPTEVVGQLEQIAQKLQNSAASGVVPRAASSDSTSFTTLSSTTTSHVLPVATDQIGTSTVSSVSDVSLSTPQASSTPRARMRRQLPTSVLPTATLPGVLSIVSSKSASPPVQSVAASALSVVLSKLGSVASQSAASKPTPSNPGVGTSRV